MINLTPREAWTTYLKEACKTEAWINNSTNISDLLKINNRELMGLFIMSEIGNKLSKRDIWRLGYDDTQSEPNDGFIKNSNLRINFESKLVTNEYHDEALSSILDTYNKYSAKGASYGKNIILIIFVNKDTDNHAIRISDLREEINKSKCPFDAVLLMGPARFDKENMITVINVYEFYPSIGSSIVKVNVGSGVTLVQSVNLPYLDSLISK